LLSTVTFAVIGPILYLTPSVVTEIGASMLMCAVSLNNIPNLPDDPKFVWMYDVKAVRHSVAEGSPAVR
jgi:hypothetical protein